MPFLKLITIFIFVHLSINAQAQLVKTLSYESQKYDAKNGLPSDVVYDCFQDSEGYMWFATPIGISRFNGHSFVNYTINDGLPDNEIFGFYEDSKKRLWLKSFNGKIGYFDLNTRQLVTGENNAELAKITITGNILSYCEDREGSIWMLGLRNQCYKLTIGGIQEAVKLDFYDPNFPYYGFTNAFYNTSDSVFLSLGPNIQRYNFEKNKFEFISRTTLRYEEHNIEIDGQIYYYNKDLGLFHWANGISKLLVDRVNLKSKIYSISKDADGYLWLGVELGACKIDPNTGNILYFLKTKSPVTRITNDIEGNFWVTTIRTGVEFWKTNYEKISHVTMENGLNSNEITAVSPEINRSILFATFPNNIYSLNAKGEEALYFKLNKGNHKITRLQSTKQENKAIVDATFLINWRQSNSKSATLYDYHDPKHRISKYRKLSGVGKRKEIFAHFSPIKNYVTTQNGDLFTTALILAKYQFIDFENVKYTIYENTYGGRIYAIAEATHNNIWYGGTQGVAILNAITDSVVFRKQLGATISDIVSINDSMTLISTLGKGLFLFKDTNIIKNWEEQRGISSNSCFRIIMGENNWQYYIGSDKGVTRLEFNTDYSSEEITIFGNNGVLASGQINDLYYQDSTLYLGTNDGLYFFNPAKLLSSTSKPILKTVFSSISANSEGSRRITYNTANTVGVKFTFEPIAFYNGKVLQYNYQLYRENDLVFEQNTTKTENLEVILPSLNPGNYKLIVKCSRNDNLWSDPQVVTFFISPPWWRHPLIYLFYALLIITTSFLTMKLLGAKRRRQEIEKLNKEQEKNEIKEKMLSLQQEKLNMEQESLRAKINPHFIFNALNAISSFVYLNDTKNLKIELPKVAAFIRKSLTLTKSEFISATKEMDYLKEYLEIEKLRFEDKLIYKFNIIGELPNHNCIPPLLLQIFVENSLKYGKNPTTKIVQLNITFESKNDILYCTIEDTGKGIQPKSTNTSHESMGIQIAEKRISVLNQLFGSGMELAVSNISPKSGTRVQLSIPFNKNIID